jgi:hypothetical protein
MPSNHRVTLPDGTILHRVGSFGRWREVTLYWASIAEGDGHGPVKQIVFAGYREPSVIDGKLFMADTKFFRLRWEPIS